MSSAGSTFVSTALVTGELTSKLMGTAVTIGVGRTKTSA